jgi:hypothetical protein
MPDATIDRALCCGPTCKRGTDATSRTAIDDLTQRILEAAARALHDAMSPGIPWQRATRLTQRRRRANARACLTAALAAAEGDGVVLVKVPEPLAPAGDAAGQYMLGAVAGYNNCRAATLAAKVTL